jgi:hypothetical protein
MGFVASGPHGTGLSPRSGADMAHLRHPPVTICPQQPSRPHPPCLGSDPKTCRPEACHVPGPDRSRRAFPSGGVTAPESQRMPIQAQLPGPPSRPRGHDRGCPGPRTQRFAPRCTRRRLTRPTGPNRPRPRDSPWDLSPGESQAGEADAAQYPSPGRLPSFSMFVRASTFEVAARPAIPVPVRRTADGSA